MYLRLHHWLICSKDIEDSFGELWLTILEENWRSQKSYRNREVIGQRRKKRNMKMKIVCKKCQFLSNRYLIDHKICSIIPPKKGKIGKNIKRHDTWIQNVYTVRSWGWRRLITRVMFPTRCPTLLSVQGSKQPADKWTSGDEQHFPLGLSWKRLTEPPPLSIPRSSDKNVIVIS